MKPRRGRTIAILSAALATVVLVGAVFAFRTRILEEWYLFRLDSKNVETRKAAAARLGEIGSGRSVRRLLELWSCQASSAPLIVPKKGGNSDRRGLPVYALDALSSMGSRGMPELIHSLGDEDPWMRVTAALAIAKMGPSGENAAPALAQNLKDAEENVRRAAMLALVHLDRATVALISPMLKDPSPLLRLTAISTLSNVKGAEAIEAIPMLLEVISGQDEELCMEMISDIQGASKANGLFRALLPALLAHPSRNIRITAVMYARDAGPAAIGPEGVSALFSMLANGDLDGGDLENSALIDLGKMGMKEAIAILKSGKGDLAGLDPAAIPGMIKGLSDNAPQEVQRASIIALGHLGSRAREAIPILLMKLKWRDDGAPIAAAALIKITDVPFKLETARLGDPDFHSQLIKAVKRLGQDGPAAVPALIPKLKDPSVQVRYNTAFAIGNFGPEAAPAVPSLIEALKDENEGVRTGAASSLGEIGPAARDAVPLLRTLLSTNNIVLRNTVTDALAKIGSE